jgi:hypothetical protein
MRRRSRPAHRPSLPPVALSLALVAAVLGCGARPFAEGTSRELTVITDLPPDSPEVLLLRAIVERPAIRIEDEKAYVMRLARPDDARAYRSRLLLFLGTGPISAMPSAVRRLGALLGEVRAPYLFTPEVWLRGQAVGLFWTPAREDLLPELQRCQNLLFEHLDRAAYATVRSRVLSLPHDHDAEERVEGVLGLPLRVPRGYEVLTAPDLRAVLLVDEGPPTRLLRIRLAPSEPGADLLRARTGLARAFRPNERTLDLQEPVLVPREMAGAVRQCHGRWEDAVVSAAGPFRFYEVARGTRRYYVDLAVFAPGRPKLPYLRELQAVAETLGTP